ncbi:serine/threonine protein kinase [Nonomuraea sp. MG754425]|uniref:serine/threonine-protein kinase n=1 Tax=Nonomuraea sp. MG754425 TaxID=2570319 RepID=UPI001F19FB3F|nr:serine/threonine-protein kinase [Nonomuraea sp. MG754425]MCF6469879.1 serine/threonine protein kinase [Nonomuraea sp. MG754425]
MTDAPARHLLAGRYRLRGPVGAGGMGRVWLARDELLGRDVAVKEVLLPPAAHAADRAAAYERVLGEARIADRVRHPGVVRLLDVVAHGGRPWIVMEILHGRSLREAVGAEGALTARRVAAIGGEVLSALAFVHASGVLHRDVKPANVFLRRDGHTVLTDFGVATVEGQAPAAEGMVAGSPGYIAPELLRGERGGPASDLWSLGATLYYAVEGVPPYPGDTPPAVLAAVLTLPPRPPVLAGGALSPVLLALLARAPADRPDTTATRATLAKIAETGPAVASTEPGAAMESAEAGLRG